MPGFFASPAAPFLPLFCRARRLPPQGFFKICRHWRTCADNGDTAREILPKIVCEEPATSARFWAKFCRRLRSRAPPAADAARRSRGSGRRAQAPYLARRAMRAPQPGLSKGGNRPVRHRRAGLFPSLQPYKAAYACASVRASSAWVPSDSQMMVGARPRAFSSASSGACGGPYAVSPSVRWHFSPPLV